MQLTFLFLGGVKHNGLVYLILSVLKFFFPNEVFILKVSKATQTKTPLKLINS